MKRNFKRVQRSEHHCAFCWRSYTLAEVEDSSTVFSTGSKPSTRSSSSVASLRLVHNPLQQQDPTTLRSIDVTVQLGASSPKNSPSERSLRVISELFFLLVLQNLTRIAPVSPQSCSCCFQRCAARNIAGCYHTPIFPNGLARFGRTAALAEVVVLRMKAHIQSEFLDRNGVAK